jgi:ferritin-like metal-binding protein YciE
MKKEDKEVLEKLLVHELGYLYSAESQVIEVVPGIINAAIEGEMKSLMEEHLYKTTHHKFRLEKIGSALQVDIKGTYCRATRSLIDEMNEIMMQHADSFYSDIVLLQAVLRLQKYEIARYKCALYLAMQLEYTDTALELHIVLNEEKKMDALLTKLALDHIDKNKEKEEQLVQS